MINYIQKIVFILMLGMITIAFSQDNTFFTLSTTKARPLAMAGAYTAIEDDIVSASYNPATLNLYESKKDFRLTIHLNPIAPLTIFYERYNINNQHQTNHHRSPNFFKTVSLLMKSLVVTGRFIDIALIFHEQIPDDNYLSRQKKFFQNCDLLDNGYHSLVTSVKLADRVALGISTSIYLKKMNNDVQHGVGFSYGMLLKPAPEVNVGLAFVDFPRRMPEVRLPLERLADQTMNVGICYKPTASTVLSFDLRNLTEDEQKGVREAHFGIEQTIFSLIAIRGGYFQERFSTNRTISGGIALLDSNLLFSTENHFNHSQFILNYSFIHQQHKNQIVNWHVLSLLIRI